MKAMLAQQLVVVICVLLVAQSALAFYNPSTGRWLNRDPNEERAGYIQREGMVEGVFGTHFRNEPNLYAFVANNPIMGIDPFGLFSNFENCSCCQIEALKIDEAIAQVHMAVLRKQIQSALPDILANPSKYPYRTGYKFNTALTKLRKASVKLKTGTVKCDPASNGRIAWTLPWGNTVTAYDSYWWYSDSAQGAHLVHEGTHMGSGTTDAAYFWQNQDSPHDTFFVPWNSIASTYDTWIITGFCIPGHNCPPSPVPIPNTIYRSQKECP